MLVGGLKPQGRPPPDCCRKSRFHHQIFRAAPYSMASTREAMLLHAAGKTKKPSVPFGNAGHKAEGTRPSPEDWPLFIPYNSDYVFAPIARKWPATAKGAPLPWGRKSPRKKRLQSSVWKRTLPSRDIRLSLSHNTKNHGRFTPRLLRR